MAWRRNCSGLDQEFPTYFVNGPHVKYLSRAGLEKKYSLKITVKLCERAQKMRVLSVWTGIKVLHPSIGTMFGTTCWIKFLVDTVRTC